MDKNFEETLLESILERQESHWAKRKSTNGKAQVSGEYAQHKKTRNATGAARDQDKRKRNTKKGHQQAAARDAVRRKKEQGKLKEPASCSVCGKVTSDKIFDHDGSYEKSDQLKGRFMCRECHNRKDNNKSGTTSTKGQRRQGIIGRSDGSREIQKTKSESTEKHSRRRCGICGFQRPPGTQQMDGLDCRCKKTQPESFDRVMADLNDPGPASNNPLIDIIAECMIDPLDG